MSLSTYDPSAEATLITALEQPADEKPKRPPEGLLKNEPEKNVDESQMADFATPIEEIMPGPNQMIQDEIMGPPSLPQSGNVKTPRKSESKKSKAPFGLTEEQFTAAIAGLAAAIAFSKPVQSKLSTSVPKFLSESGEMSVTGMVVSALVAAIVFYFAKQFLADKV